MVKNAKDVLHRIMGDNIGKNKITSTYGVIVKGELVPYGTEDEVEAKARAKQWKGKIIKLR